MGPIDLGADAFCYEDRCRDRLTLANTMSSVNMTLRNSGGTSIIIWRLGRAPAEDEECNRRNGAAGAVDSENIQCLSLRALPPLAANFDASNQLQPKIAVRPRHKSRCIFVDPDFRDGLVKTPLWGGNHIEFILNRM